MSNVARLSPNPRSGLPRFTHRFSVTQGIRISARRTRPDGTSLSFPSGHTASVFRQQRCSSGTTAGRLGYRPTRWRGYVGASRLSENRHFLSDVIFGATIGIVAGRTVTIGHGGSRFALAPLVTPAGVGVELVKISR